MKVGGEAYNNIIDDLGFESDVAPPPLFLVQAYSVVQQINNADTNELRAKRIAQYKDFVKAHDDSNTKWNSQLKTQRGRDFKNSSIRTPPARRCWRWSTRSSCRSRQKATDPRWRNCCAPRSHLRSKPTRLR